MASSIPVITTTSLGDFSVDVTFSVTLSVTGASPITWSVFAGTLPTGVSLNTSTGEISGTPTVAGAYDFTVSASNDWGTDTQRFLGAVSPVFNAKNATRVKFKIGGEYYKIPQFAKIDGNFVGAMSRN